MRLFLIERQGPGRLWTMTAPDGGQALPGELARVRESGVDVLVSMLSGVESAWLGLGSEAKVARTAGLRFARLPTNDFGTPRRHRALEMARELRGELLQGRGVAVHCQGGIGRSSLLAAIVLRLDGVRPDEAWRRIAQARGAEVPDTRMQRDFVDRLDAGTW